MKTRVIVALLAVPILVAIIFFAPAWAFGLTVGVIAACSAWELLCCSEDGAKRRIFLYAAVSAFVIPVWLSLDTGTDGTPAVVFLLCFLIFGELMWSFRGGQTMELETVAMVLLAGAVIPLLLFFPGSPEPAGEYGRVYALLPLVVTFSSDSAPPISPGVSLAVTSWPQHLSPTRRWKVPSEASSPPSR
jgi:phosphatidate cytidylyltransferase